MTELCMQYLQSIASEIDDIESLIFMLAEMSTVDDCKEVFMTNIKGCLFVAGQRIMDIQSLIVDYKKQLEDFSNKQE